MEQAVNQAFVSAISEITGQRGDDQTPSQALMTSDYEPLLTADGDFIVWE